MSRETIVRLKAARDIDQIAVYLATEGSTEVGYRFLIEANKAFALLARSPSVGWPAQIKHSKLKGLRIFRIGDFDKILILYRPLPKGVEILRVVHGARNLQALFRRRGEFE